MAGWTSDNAKFREYGTAEVPAVVAGARDAGATASIVANAHGNMQNRLFERFTAGVLIVRSTTRPLMMLEGIDSSFSASIGQR